MIMIKTCIFILYILFAFMSLHTWADTKTTHTPNHQTNKLKTQDESLIGTPFEQIDYGKSPATTITQKQLNTRFSFRYGDWLQPGVPDTVGLTIYVNRINERIFEIRTKRDNPKLKPYEYDITTGRRVAMVCLPMDIAQKAGYDGFYWIEKHFPNKKTQNYIFLLHKDDVLADLAKQYPRYTLLSEFSYASWSATFPDSSTYCWFYKSYLME